MLNAKLPTHTRRCGVVDRCAEPFHLDRVRAKCLRLGRVKHQYTALDGALGLAPGDRFWREPVQAVPGPRPRAPPGLAVAPVKAAASTTGATSATAVLRASGRMSASRLKRPASRSSSRQCATSASPFAPPSSSSGQRSRSRMCLMSPPGGCARPTRGECRRESSSAPCSLAAARRADVAQATATASISTFHSGRTRPATTMVVDAAL